MEQDWQEVVIKGKKNPKLSSAKVQHFAGNAAIKALAQTTDVIKPKFLSSEAKQTIVNMRAAQKWSQVDLNTKCALPLNTIRDIESGKSCPSAGQLNIINRILKTNIRLS